MRTNWNFLDITDLPKTLACLKPKVEKSLEEKFICFWGKVKNDNVERKTYPGKKDGAK